MLTLPELKAFRRWEECAGDPVVRLCGVDWLENTDDTNGDLHYQRNGLILTCEDNDPHAWQAQVLTVFPRQYGHDVEGDEDLSPTPELALAELLACLISLSGALTAALRAVVLKEWEGALSPEAPEASDAWHGHGVSVSVWPPIENDGWWTGTAGVFPYTGDLKIEARANTRAGVLRKLRRELLSGASRAHLNARYIGWILDQARHTSSCGGSAIIQTAPRRRRFEPSSPLPPPSSPRAPGCSAAPRQVLDPGPRRFLASPAMAAPLVAAGRPELKRAPGGSG